MRSSCRWSGRTCLASAQSSLNRPLRAAPGALTMAFVHSESNDALRAHSLGVLLMRAPWCHVRRAFHCHTLVLRAAMSSQDSDPLMGGAPPSLREHWERILRHLEALYAQRPSDELQ